MRDNDALNSLADQDDVSQLLHLLARIQHNAWLRERHIVDVARDVLTTDYTSAAGAEASRDTGQAGIQWNAVRNDQERPHSTA